MEHMACWSARHAPSNHGMPSHVVTYAGMSTSVDVIPGLAQAPHRPVREMGSAPTPAGVYISRWHHGSPAHRYSLYALNWITELNGTPVPDLDTFVRVANSLPDKSFARLKLCQLEMNKTKVSMPASMLHAWSHGWPALHLLAPSLLHVGGICLNLEMSNKWARCFVAGSLLHTEEHCRNGSRSSASSIVPHKIGLGVVHTGAEHQAGPALLANMGAAAGPCLWCLVVQHHQLKPASVVSVIRVTLTVYSAKFLCLLVSLCHIHFVL